MSTFLKFDLVVGLILFYVYMAGVTKRHLWPKYEWTGWFIEGRGNSWDGCPAPFFAVIFWPVAWIAPAVLVPVWKLGLGTFKAGAGKEEP